jgi:hypothetical protein
VTNEEQQLTARYQQIDQQLDRLYRVDPARSSPEHERQIASLSDEFERVSANLQKAREQPPKLSVVRDSVPHYRGGRESGKETGWRLTSLLDLYSEPQEAVAWLVSDLLPTGGISLLAARPKVGKSTLARQLSACVASGLPFLGRDCAQGVVAYLALEEKRAAITDHFRRMEVPSDAPIFIHTGAAPIADPEKLLRTVIAECAAKLVVIDPLQHFLRVEDISNYSEVSNGIAAIIEVARSTGTHILVTHHTNKADSGQGEERALLGSTALFGGVDTLLMMSRSNDVRSVTSSQRYGADMPATAIRLDKNGHVELAGTVVAMKERQLVNEIVDVLKAHGEMTEEQICKRMERQRPPVRDALRSQTARELIARRGEGVRGDPYRYSVMDS